MDKQVAIHFIGGEIKIIPISDWMDILRSMDSGAKTNQIFHDRLNQFVYMINLENICFVELQK